MVIQKLELHEWFLVYQLDQIKRHSNHLTTQLKLDLSHLADQYRIKNLSIPTTAIVLQIIGKWANENPEINKMLFKTWRGFHFLMGSEIRVNLPLEIFHQGKSIITAIVIKDPHLKSVHELNEEIKQAKTKKLEAFPITKFAHSRKNLFWNRWLLKALHSVLFRAPGLYWKKGGGCISFSSLTNASQKQSLFSFFSYGPTGYTFFCKDLEQIQGKTILRLNISIDHNCFSGLEITRDLNRLIKMVQTDAEYTLPTTSVSTYKDSSTARQL